MKTPLIRITGNKIEDTLRAMEAAHAVYMDTSRFSPEFEAVNAKMEETRDAWLAAVKESNPTWIVM